MYFISLKVLLLKWQVNYFEIFKQNNFKIWGLTSTIQRQIKETKKHPSFFKFKGTNSFTSALKTQD